MRNPSVHHFHRERFFSLLVLLGALAVATSGRASERLPFDPGKICRYSIDNIPRSISIRQGPDVWFGYDLEHARVFKVWKAPADEPGVIVSSFKAKSSGTALFEGKAGEPWSMKMGGETVPLTVRYLGCVQDKESFELSWELGHPDGTIKLTERIVTSLGGASSQAQRMLRVESMEPGHSLVLPEAYRNAWVLKGPEGKTVSTLDSSAWHQLSLP